MALLDSGSDINITSKALFEGLPEELKSSFEPCTDKISVANGESVGVCGKARIKVCTPYGKHRITVYILENVSVPLILGTGFLSAKGISLNFSKHSIRADKFKVRTRQEIHIPPNSESLIWLKAPRNAPQGLQGVCAPSSEMKNSDLLVSKTVVTVTSHHSVPVKVMNPSNEEIVLTKGKVVAKFRALDDSDRIIPVKLDDRKVGDPLTCVNSVHKSSSENTVSGKNVPGKEKFLSNFDLTCDTLTGDQQEKLKDVLYKNKDVFVTEENPGLGFTKLVEHKIHLKPDAKFKHQRPYRLAPDKREVLRQHLDDLLKQGIIAPASESDDLPITSPIVLVLKKKYASANPDSKNTNMSMYRFCVDFRHLNEQTQDFNYAIPDLQELTESFADNTPRYMTTLDISSSFFQQAISEESTKYTAFNTCFGTYYFKRMPMGLKTASNSFQLLMDKVLRGLTFKSVLCYFDDIICFSTSFEQHLLDLQVVFDRLRAAGLKLGPHKCTFAQDKCIFLGHEISSQGIRPPSDRVKAISDFPPPKNPKEVRRLMGMLNWFRKFIPRFSEKARPINMLLKKGVKFVWTQECDASLSYMKHALIHSEALAFPRFDLPFRISVDTSSHGIGYTLYQVHPPSEFPPGTTEKDRVRVVRFGSKPLTGYQQSYGPTKLELLGLVTSVLDCAPYVRGRKFVVECDHQALRPLFQKKLSGAIYDRMLAILQSFDVEIQYKPAAQMVVQDALSRCHPNPKSGEPVSSPDDESPIFPYIEEKTTGVTLPGGVNLHDLLHPSANDDISGNPKKHHVHRVSKVRKPTYNAATPNPTKHVYVSDQLPEYDADSDDSGPLFVPKPRCKHDPKLTPPALVAMAPSIPQSDSSEEQFMGWDTQGQPVHCDQDGARPAKYTQTEDTDSHTTNDHLAPQTNGLSPQVSTTEHSTHSDPVSADSDQNNITPAEPTCVTGECSDSNIESIVDSYDQQIHNIDLWNRSDFSPESMSQLQRNDPELKPVIDYLTSGKLPKSQKAARRLLLLSADYIIVNDLLFHSRVPRKRRTKDLCQYQLVLPEVAISTIVSLYHECPLAGHAGIQTTIDRIQQNFHFEKLTVRVTEFVKSCSECQKRKMTKAHTKAGITAFPTPTQPFQVWEVDLYGPLPTTPSGNSYIFTAVCMFSKVVFAVPLANKDAMSVSNALFQLVSTYGVCDTLISDLGTEFTSKVTQQLCALLHVPQQFTPAFVHHCLGAVERSHATLAERLTPYMNQSRKNWEDLLPAVVFSMNSSVKESLGYSPFEILYGQRPKFPLSSTLPNTDLNTVPSDMHAFLKLQQTRINLIRDEVRQNAEKAKLKMVKNANTDLKPLHVQEGDYVYLSTTSAGQGRKLRDKYTGPFVVKEVQSSHMIVLKNPDTGRTMQQPVHVNRLKIAYVRQPTPHAYFPSKVSTKVSTEDRAQASEADSSAGPPANLGKQSTEPPRRSARKLQPPDRYVDPNHVNLDPTKVTDSETVSSDSRGYHKIKRVLGQRQKDDKIEYLVQIVGEPSYKSIWVTPSQLDSKARKAVQDRAPNKIPWY